MSHRIDRCLVRFWALFTIAVLGQAAVAARGLDAGLTAERVDTLLATELGKNASTSAQGPGPASAPAAADDETFLRRIHLDLIGELPSAAEITAFALDTAADKRARVADRLLNDPRYGQNWGRYWRDVILYRRSDDRALLASESVVRYLSEQFNQGASWQKIARELITAEGNIGEDGRTALIAAQWGETPETAAEVSRILMGVQIQCAQCHDHKTDRWKRTQFHEFAAFFPRIAVRPIRGDDNKRLGFELVSKGGDGGAKRKKPNANQKLAKRLEHYMPDLEDAAAEGTLMQPVFFQTGDRLSTGASDQDRRAALADWLTSDKNPWFAQAIVNRVWGELVGEGFYEPIDDLGPDRVCTAPQAMQLLTEQFIYHDYDLKWLLRTITTTDVYARQSRPRRNPTQPAFEATCPQPLRADQIFNSLASALNLQDEAPPAAADMPGLPALRFARTPRGQFNVKFGFDPSAPRDEMTGSIDQALLLMNSPPLNRAMVARTGGDRAGPTVLAHLLETTKDDNAVIMEIYLRCLAREPKEREVNTCREYLVEVPNRAEAFEDILWALINSTEFLYRD